MAGKGKREISRRIKAVKSTQQITKAMKLVAAAKLRRAQERVLAARPYARRLEEVLGRLSAQGELQHPLFEQRERRRVAYVIVTGDRGLCGSYNVNIIRKAASAMRSSAAEPVPVAIGRKGRDFFTRRGRKFLREWVGVGEDPNFVLAKEIAGALMSLFLSGEVDEARLIYTEFISALRQKPVEVQLLPVAPPEAESRPRPAKGRAVAEVQYLFEPSGPEVLDVLVPKSVEVQVYRTLLEAKASEQGARMTAMGSATDNATEMIGKLTLAFNRARQAAITREISEIVGGAEALK